MERLQGSGDGHCHVTVNRESRAVSSADTDILYSPQHFADTTVEIGADEVDVSKSPIPR